MGSTNYLLLGMFMIFLNIQLIFSKNNTLYYEPSKTVLPLFSPGLNNTYFMGRYGLETLVNESVDISLGHYFKGLFNFIQLENFSCPMRNCTVTQPELQLEQISTFTDNKSRIYDFVVDDNLVYSIVQYGIKIINISKTDFSFISSKNFYDNRIAPSNDNSQIFIKEFSKEFKFLFIRIGSTLYYSLINSTFMNIGEILKLTDLKILDSKMKCEIFNSTLIIPDGSNGLKAFTNSNGTLSPSDIIERANKEIMKQNIKDLYILDLDENNTNLIILNSNLELISYKIQVNENDTDELEINKIGVISQKNYSFIFVSSMFAKPTIITLFFNENGDSNYQEFIYKNASWQPKNPLKLDTAVISMDYYEDYSIIWMKNLISLIRIGTNTTQDVIPIPGVKEARIMRLNYIYYIIYKRQNELVLTEVKHSDLKLRLIMDIPGSIYFRVSGLSRHCIEGPYINFSVVNNGTICNYGIMIFLTGGIYNQSEVHSLFFYIIKIILIIFAFIVGGLGFYFYRLIQKSRSQYTEKILSEGVPTLNEQGKNDLKDSNISASEKSISQKI